MTPYYQDDLVTLYHGDCREVLPTLLPVDLVVTDPPYAFGGKRPEWRITASIAIALSQTAGKVNRGGAMAVMAAASGRGIEYVQSAVGPTLPFNRLLIWHKQFVNSPVAGPWRWDIVPVLVFGRASFGRPEMSSCYISDGHSRLKDFGHPAALPRGIGAWLIEPFRSAKTVLDPFCGTGVFLAAAKQADKHVIGIEIEERWCEATVQRLAQKVLALEAG